MFFCGGNERVCSNSTWGMLKNNIGVCSNLKGGIPRGNEEINNKLNNIIKNSLISQSV